MSLKLLPPSVRGPAPGTDPILDWVVGLLVLILLRLVAVGLLAYGAPKVFGDEVPLKGKQGDICSGGNLRQSNGH
jgi:hypothetical protein